MVTNTRLILTALIASLGLLVSATAAFGADIALTGHGTTAGDAQDGVAAGVVDSGGTLPFTGLNLVFIVIGGLALLAVGVLLRRRGASSRA